MTKKFLAAVTVIIGVCFFAVQANSAEVSWKTLKLSTGDSFQALYGLPDGQGPWPALIFSHGTGVRHLGYEGAVREGNMDVKDYVEALSAQGYVVIAPIRPFLRNKAYQERGKSKGSAENWDQVIRKGIDSIHAARIFLRNSGDVGGKEIAVIGFSEGGNISLWAAIEQPDQYAALLMLSPATVGSSPRYELRRAASRDHISRLTMPVFLSMGKRDNRSILKITRKKLIPRLEVQKIPLLVVDGYSGDHKWFHRVRSEHMADIQTFLAAHLQK